MANKFLHVVKRHLQIKQVCATFKFHEICSQPGKLTTRTSEHTDPSDSELRPGFTHGYERLLPRHKMHHSCFYFRWRNERSAFDCEVVTDLHWQRHDLIILHWVLRGNTSTAGQHASGTCVGTGDLSVHEGKCCRAQLVLPIYLTEVLGHDGETGSLRLRHSRHHALPDFSLEGENHLHATVPPSPTPFRDLLQPLQQPKHAWVKRH